MANYSHLCKEQRITIEELLKENKTFTFIAKALKVDRTTISKEIRRNRHLTRSVLGEFSKNGINKAIKSCNKLTKPPYCCNACPFKSKCIKSHLYYNARKAQDNYENNLVVARSGIDITKDEIDTINKVIVPLVKNKKQSVNQIFINHPDILYFSKTTFYKYVNDKVILLDNLDLPRKVRYKKRKYKNKKTKRDDALLIGRTYEDYLAKTGKNENLIIWELDTVIGRITDTKCLMTFILVETNFMIIRLLDKKDVANVNKAFAELKKDLGIELYSKVIDVIVTDNGTEFFNPIYIENDLTTGEKVCNLYYCHPSSPEEKPELEKNHEYIRYVLPKKTSFQNLTSEDIKRLEDNINNIPREILGNATPYNLTKEKYPEIIKRLNSRYIEPDDVSLNPKDILGGQNNDK